MKRIYALSIIIAYILFERCIESESEITELLERAVEESPTHELTQAMLVYFGTINPPNQVIQAFVKTWADDIKHNFLIKIPRYMVGLADLRQDIIDSLI